MAHMKVKDPGNVQTTSVHPLVRTHPETGRKALYIGGHVQHFDGMTDEESEPLIAFLKQHSIRPEFTCPGALGKRHADLLGQPLHAALRDQRLPGGDPHHAPHHGLRRHPVLTARAIAAAWIASQANQPLRPVMDRTHRKLSTTIRRAAPTMHCRRKFRAAVAAGLKHDVIAAPGQVAAGRACRLHGSPSNRSPNTRRSASSLLTGEGEADIHRYAVPATGRVNSSGGQWICGGRHRRHLPVKL